MSSNADTTIQNHDDDNHQPSPPNDNNVFFNAFSQAHIAPQFLQAATVDQALTAEMQEETVAEIAGLRNRISHDANHSIDPALIVVQPPTRMHPVPNSREANFSLHLEAAINQGSY